MKKIYFIAVCLTLFSCRGDENNTSSNNGILGVWKKSKEIIFSGKDNSVITTYPNNDPCESKSNTEFTNDGKVIFRTFYENSNGNCVQHPAETKTYSYDSNTKKLTINGALYGEVIKLTNSEFETKVSLGDENGDGIKDYAVEYGFK